MIIVLLINTCTREAPIRLILIPADILNISITWFNKKFRSLRSKLTDEIINNCNVQVCESKTGEFIVLLQEFDDLYKDVKDKLFIEGLIDNDENLFADEKYGALMSYFNNPLVHFYFRMTETIIGNKDPTRFMKTIKTLSKCLVRLQLRFK